MKTISKLVSTSGVSLLVIASPVLISGSYKKASPAPTTHTPAVYAAFYSSPVNTKIPAYYLNSETPTAPSVAATTGPAGLPDAVTSESKASEARDAAAKKALETKMVIKEANLLYLGMRLQGAGLNQKAFEYAWRGYHNLVKSGLLKKSSVLTICDFTQSSRHKRLYVIDVIHQKLLFNTYVAHGLNSGTDYATSFSNRADSYKSSLGFFLTSKAYVGKNGLTLKFNGLEKGYNDNAARRNLVLHGSDYVTQDYLKNNGEMGRSLGSAMVPTSVNKRIIRTIKDGSCYFVYSPAKKYLARSAVING